MVLEFFLLPRGFINDSFVWPLNNLHYCEIKGISPQMFGWLNFFNWSRPLNNPSNAQEPSSLMNENSWIGELIKWQDWWLISILQLFGKLISNHPNVSLIDVLVHHLLIIFYLSKSQVILVMICYLAKAITLGFRLHLFSYREIINSKMLVENKMLFLKTVVGILLAPCNLKNPLIQILENLGNKTNVLSLPFVENTSTNWSMPFIPIKLWAT